MSPFHVGCCITAHGFGHAARVMAVMEALGRLTDLKLTVATLVPEWFIRESYPDTFTYVPVQTDIGLVQKNPLEQDIPATLRALEDYYPLRPDPLDKLAMTFADCDMVVCDISPAGILAAREAGVPSVLVENFTWDWIYEGYSKEFPGLEKFIDYLNGVFMSADYRVQAEPVCAEMDSDLMVPPVARAFRSDRKQVRNKLGVTEDQQCVLISMGGVSLAELPLKALQQYEKVSFIISGYIGIKIQAPNLHYLTSDLGLFHPDIVRSCDAVIGKVGYSTLAEVFHADVPLGYVSRKDFRESVPLVSFIEREMRGMEIDFQSFSDGSWLEMLPRLIQLPDNSKVRKNGAEMSARFILRLLEKA